VTPLGSAAPAVVALALALGVAVAVAVDAFDVDDAAADRLGAAVFEVDVLADVEPPLVLPDELEHAARQNPNIDP
jgi:hypothetical protein